MAKHNHRHLSKAEGQIPSADVLAEVQQLLNEGARRAAKAQRFCSGLADCCRFRQTGETPHVTLGEAWLVCKAWKATGRTKISLPDDGSCPFLNHHGLCLIYEARPLACRTHFCVQAGGALPRKEVIDLIHQLEDIDVKLGGDGAARLPDAVSRLMKYHTGKAKPRR